jgi:hypothetical protein
MKTLVGIAAALLIAIGFWSQMSDQSKPLTTASVAPSNLTRMVSITRAEWQRGGIGGTVAVAEFGVRNNADFAVRIDAVTCRFQKPGHEVEERTSTTYEIVQPRDQRTIRNLGFGFIDADLKSACIITKAQKA